MDWAKFERMGELYGEEVKPKKRRRKYESKKLTWRKFTQIRTKGMPSNLLGYRQALLKFQKRLRKNPTKAENRFRNILTQFFETQPNTILHHHIAVSQAIFLLETQPGKYKGYIADFYLPGFQLIIEIDGQYHQANQEYDQNRDKALCRKRGIRTLRITNQQTKNKDACISALRFALKEKFKQYKIKPKPLSWDVMPMKHVKITGPVVKLRKANAKES